MYECGVPGRKVPWHGSPTPRTARRTGGPLCPLRQNHGEGIHMRVFVYQSSNFCTRRTSALATSQILVSSSRCDLVGSKLRQGCRLGKRWLISHVVIGGECSGAAFFRRSGIHTIALSPCEGAADRTPSADDPPRTKEQGPTSAAVHIASSCSSASTNFERGVLVPGVQELAPNHRGKIPHAPGEKQRCVRGSVVQIGTFARRAHGWCEVCSLGRRKSHDPLLRG